MQPIKDWVLLLMICAMVLLDIIFLIVVTPDVFRLMLNVKLLPQEVILLQSIH